MVRNVVAVFISKTKKAGSPNWAYVADFNSGEAFVKWFTERRAFYRQVHITWPEDFKTIVEVDEFKAWLKGLLNIDKSPNWSVGDKRWDYYDGMNMDMFIYKEDEFDKLIENYKEEK